MFSKVLKKYCGDSLYLFLLCLNFIFVFYIIVKMKRFCFILIIFVREIYCHVAVDHKMARSQLFHNKINDLFVPNKENNFTPAPKHFGPYIGSCVKGAECVQFVSCPAHVRITPKDYCNTMGGRKGVCCKTGQNHTEAFDSKDRGHHIIKLDSTTLGSLTKKCRNEIAALRSKEAKLLSDHESKILLRGSASYSHFRNSRRFNLADLTEVTNVANRALEIAIATKVVKNRQGLSNLQLELGMLQQDLRDTSLGHNCLPPPFCTSDLEIFRRIDGSCNNPNIPTWGTSLSPFSRLLPPDYQDGIWIPRVSRFTGQELPSPRLISTTIFSEENNPNKEYTLLVMQFGQFLSHDITHSPDITYMNGSAISCCTDDGIRELPIQHRHYACIPIRMPENDAFFGSFKQGCMNFVRSVLSPRHDCSLGYAQQMNKVTHFIDGSTVYGSAPEQTAELRSFDGGRLNVFSDFGRELLPLSKDPDACLTMEQGSACFVSGDTRTNQMVTLVVLHTVFMREHNRLADILADLNPHWDDERLFLEARRIVISELQVITYKEYLPALLGDLAMEEFDLHLGRGFEYGHGYDERVDPSVINEFAAAAFRFGHSSIDGVLKMYGQKKMEEMVFLPELMFYPGRIRKRPFLDEVLSTLTTEPVQEVDDSIPDALTNYLFRAGNPFGVDLAAINIQRGRDHGLRPYNDYRELVGLPRFTSFVEFGPKMGEKLQRLYASVDDVDLWIGGLLETKAPGSLVGPTFRDIIAEQFSRLKKGDRYFFENEFSVNPGSLTPEQLMEVRKASMARLICDNSDGILLARQAPNAFRKPGVQGNEFVDCKSPVIPKLNLIYWQE